MNHITKGHSNSILIVFSLKQSVSIAVCPGLASCLMKAYGVCSKAFIKLESLDSLTPEQRRQYEELSVEIFAKYASCYDLHLSLFDFWVLSCITCRVISPSTNFKYPVIIRSSVMTQYDCVGYIPVVAIVHVLFDVICDHELKKRCTFEIVDAHWSVHSLYVQLL